MPDTFRCTVVTPSGQPFDDDVTSAVVPAHDGLIGILHNRAPILVELGSGDMTVKSNTGEKSFKVEGGYAQMLDNTLTVLTKTDLLDSDGE